MKCSDEKKYCVMLTKPEIELLMYATDKAIMRERTKLAKGILNYPEATKVCIDELGKLNSRLYQKILKIYGVA